MLTLSQIVRRQLLAYPKSSLHQKITNRGIMSHTHIQLMYKFTKSEIKLTNADRGQFIHYKRNIIKFQKRRNQS